MATQRKGLSKRLRFEVFKRDGFRCVYCGATPQDAALHVDHVIPVASNGTDDPSNLVTACGGCNGGKGAVPLGTRKLGTGRVTDENRDHADQIREWLALQREVSAAKNEVANTVLEEWEARVGRVPTDLRAKLPSLVAEFTPVQLCDAFSIVGRKGIPTGQDQMKYLHGILRKWRAERRDEVSPEVAQEATSIESRLYEWARIVEATFGDSLSLVAEMFVRATAPPDLFWSEATNVSDAIQECADNWAYCPEYSLEGQGAYILKVPGEDSVVFGVPSPRPEWLPARCLGMLLRALDENGPVSWRQFAWLEGLCKLDTARQSPLPVLNAQALVFKSVEAEAEWEERSAFRREIEMAWIRTDADFQRWLNERKQTTVAVDA